MKRTPTGGRVTTSDRVRFHRRLELLAEAQQDGLFALPDDAGHLDPPEPRQELGEPGRLVDIPRGADFPLFRDPNDLQILRPPVRSRA
jgi:hypothetical protein